MKIKEVEYSRLFNLADYQNERIGFKAEITDSENPNEVIGQLFFKVLEVENVFQKYRELQEARKTKNQLKEMIKAGKFDFEGV
jgi:hypothetical protein